MDSSKIDKKPKQQRPLPKLPVSAKNVLYPSSSSNSSSESERELAVERFKSDNNKEGEINPNPTNNVSNNKNALNNNINQNIANDNSKLNIPNNYANVDYNMAQKPGSYGAVPLFLNPVSGVNTYPLRTIPVPTPTYRRRHHQYIVASKEYKDAEKLSSAIQGEHHMHVKPAQFISVVTDEVLIVVCKPDAIFDHCKIMDSLIKSQQGKAVCVCILPNLSRRNIVDAKQKMMAFMNEDHIVFASYDDSKIPEITGLDKFWREVDGIVGAPL